MWWVPALTKLVAFESVCFSLFYTRNEDLTLFLKMAQEFTRFSHMVLEPTLEILMR